MRDSVAITARLLTQQLDIIESQHRSEIMPTFGQLQDLFQTKDLLKKQLAHPSADVPAPKRICAVDCCPFVAAVETAPNEWHCGPHAEELATIRARMAALRPTTPPSMSLAGGR